MRPWSSMGFQHRQHSGAVLRRGQLLRDAPGEHGEQQAVRRGAGQHHRAHRPASSTPRPDIDGGRALRPRSTRTAIFTTLPSEMCRLATIRSVTQPYDQLQLAASTTTFFAKAIDQGASWRHRRFCHLQRHQRRTMDDKDSTVRRYLAQRCRPAGRDPPAQRRLPGQCRDRQCVSDIIFLQKRDCPRLDESLPEWVDTDR